MWMKFCTCIEESLFITFFIFDDYSRCENFVYKYVTLFYFYIFYIVEAANDFFASRISEGTEENCTKNLLFAVNLCKNQFFFLVNFEFKPRSAVRNDTA